MTHDELEQFNDMQKRIEALVFDAKDCVLNTSALIDRIEALEEQLQRYSEDIVGAERLYQKLSGQQQQRDASHNALCDVVGQFATWELMSLGEDGCSELVHMVDKARLPQPSEKDKAEREFFSPLSKEGAMALMSEEAERDEAMGSVIDVEVIKLLKKEKLALKAERDELNRRVMLGDDAIEHLKAERDAMRECVEVLRDVCREIDIQPDSELFFEGDKAIDKLDALNAKEGV
jgi:hypothetical protein